MDTIQKIIDANICSGCCACLAICPDSIIAFIYDQNLNRPVPFIMQDQCSKCGSCIKNCPSADLMLHNYNTNT